MIELVILFLLILLNGLFVMSEIALVSSRRARLEGMANKGDGKAKTALDLIENPEKFLSTAQIGITLISILTGVYSGDKFGHYLEPYVAKIAALEPYAKTISTGIVVFIVTIISIIFGELIPKKFGLLRAEKIARVVAAPMNVLTTIMLPVVWFLSNVTNFIFKIFGIRKASDNAVTEEEIKHMINEGSESGNIEEGEKEIIERVFHLGDRSVTSLMTHRTDIEWLDMNDTVEDVRKKFDQIVFSTFPVCEQNIDNVKGIVYVRDMLTAEGSTLMKDLVRTPLYVPKNIKSYRLLEKMKETKLHTAFIVNEYGTMEGMITLNDILEAIVGEVPQSGQEEYEIVQREDGSYLVDAQLSFYDFLSYFERADWTDEEQEYDTVAGFILHELNDIPNVGEKLEWRGFNFEIIDMDGQRIDKILLTLSPELKEEIAEEEEA